MQETIERMIARMKAENARRHAELIPLHGACRLCGEPLVERGYKDETLCNVCDAHEHGYWSALYDN